MKTRSNKPNQFLPVNGHLMVDVSTPSCPGCFIAISEDDFNMILRFMTGIRIRADRGRTGQMFRIRVRSGKADFEVPRVLLGVTDPSLSVVHLDGNRWNLLRSNLVIRPKTLVRRDTKPAHSTPYLGVSRSTRSDSYQTKICYDGRIVNLGNTKTSEQGHARYLHALARLRRGKTPLHPRFYRGDAALDPIEAIRKRVAARKAARSTKGVSK